VRVRRVAVASPPRHHRLKLSPRRFLCGSCATELVAADVPYAERLRYLLP